MPATSLHIGCFGDTDDGQPIFRWPVRSLLPTISPFLRPILPMTTFPPTTLSLLRSSPTIHHCLELSKSEMDVIRDPDLDWFTAEGKLPTGKGLYGIWSAGNLDGWVGREGPLVRDCLGGEEGGRVKILEGVPHAFCLSESPSHVQCVGARLTRLSPGALGACRRNRRQLDQHRQPVFSRRESRFVAGAADRSFLRRTDVTTCHAFVCSTSHQSDPCGSFRLGPLFPSFELASSPSILCPLRGCLDGTRRSFDIRGEPGKEVQPSYSSRSQ